MNDIHAIADGISFEANSAVCSLPVYAVRRVVPGGDAPPVRRGSRTWPGIYLGGRVAAYLYAAKGPLRSLREDL